MTNKATHTVPCITFGEHLKVYNWRLLNIFFYLIIFISFRYSRYCDDVVCKHRIIKNEMTRKTCNDDIINIVFNGLNCINNRFSFQTVWKIYCSTNLANLDYYLNLIMQYHEYYLVEYVIKWQKLIKPHNTWSG